MTAQFWSGASANAGRRLRLELVFTGLERDLTNATAHVYIEDSGEADAPAQCLATRQFSGLTVSRTHPEVTLDVALPDTAAASEPTVRVHVDTDGTGSIRPGHFINPSTVTVSDDGGAIRRVELTRVR